MNVEEALLLRAQQGNKEAFTQLIGQYRNDLYKIGKAILGNDEDIADAMQETILKCWQKLDTLKKAEYFKTWLVRILINNCNEILRQKKKSIPQEEFLAEGVRDYAYDNVEWRMFLNILEEKYRIVVLLYYEQGYKTREIAEILQITESLVKSRLSMARKIVEKNL